MIRLRPSGRAQFVALGAVAMTGLFVAAIGWVFAVDAALKAIRLPT